MLSFALSIFAGAFLLFQVQPLIAKYLLPWFGGSPSVWTTCLLFFQTLLLGGYAYAHWSAARLRPRTQAVVHVVLLVLALLFLPITPSETWKAHIEGNPTLRVLLLLAVTVGLPYLVLSATGPLLQHWYARLYPGRSPYRLYALSNVASLLALLSFPIFFEPRYTRQVIAQFWGVGLAIFCVACTYCALRLARRKEVPVETPAPTGADGSVPWGDRLLWLILPAVASLLLVATTNTLTQEVAVVPFLWVLPLSLYLFSFIICFDHERWYERLPYFTLLTAAGGAVGYLLFAGVDAPIIQQVAGFGGALFIACMVCHGELFRVRPRTEHLTSYYLHIAAGGALGSFLVAVVAPVVFDDFRELQIGWWLMGVLLTVLCFRYRSASGVLAAVVGIFAAAVLVPWLTTAQDGSAGFVAEFKVFIQEHWLGAVLIAVVFIGGFTDFRRWRFTLEWRRTAGGYLAILTIIGYGTLMYLDLRISPEVTVAHRSRNFYGALKIFEYDVDVPENHYRLLLNGITTHGLQFYDPEKSLWPTTYYGRTSGVGRAIDQLPADRGRHIGVVGLGAGTLAAYGREGDRLRFYDINPDVVTLANEAFTYLRDTPADVEIVLGDARLSMEDELARDESQQFDLLALDAFSSDAIPVHLLTREAFAVYLAHLRDDGIIAVHISNRYLDLGPVVEGLAEYFDLGVLTLPDDPVDRDFTLEYRSSWVLASRNLELLLSPEIIGFAELVDPDERWSVDWTDDHASLFEILK